MSNKQIPSLENSHAILVVSQNCPHCATVLQAFSEIIKDGGLAHLEVRNIEFAEEFSRTNNIRSVPWFQIGDLDFQGLHSKSEIEGWIKKSATSSGDAEYIAELFEVGGFSRVMDLIRSDNRFLSAVFKLLGDVETKTNIRLGIGALMEELESENRLFGEVENLTILAAHDSPQIRVDACHYLSFTNNPAAIPVLKKYLEDDDADVREIAADSLEALSG